MSGHDRDWDVIVVGGGPGGQKAAIQAAKAGARTMLIDKAARPGGECVRRGTIPSKALQATALDYLRLARRGLGIVAGRAAHEVTLAAMMKSVDVVVEAHESTIAAQLERNGIRYVQGMAALTGSHRIAVTDRSGEVTEHATGVIVLATGSRPRDPADVPVDHENVVDSDSILSMTYLPDSMAVLGSGVIACEYASIFAALGVEVTIIEKRDAPLGFLDPALSGGFRAAFEANGGTFIGNAETGSVSYDGVSKVVTTLGDGRRIVADKLLFALGRVANVAGLGLAAAGITTNARGLIDVDENLSAGVDGIYAVGDIVGFPSLAATAMEQGRRAVRHALGLASAERETPIPVGIYTIPEIATVGITERDAPAGTIVGEARFAEVTRCMISGTNDGLLRLLVDAETHRVLGMGVLGEGASELVATGQVAIGAGWRIEDLIENVFNFPTMAESFRIAALDCAGKLASAFQPVV